MAKSNRLLAIAPATGRVAYVFFVGTKLKDYGLSKQASQSEAEAAKFTQQWIDLTKPDVMVSEKISRTLKGDKTKSLLEAIQRTAGGNDLLDIALERPRHLDTKYHEGTELAARYPELSKRLPVFRRFYDPEPRDTVFIDALILAEAVLYPEKEVQA